MPPDEPSATSPTPANETLAASQNRRERRSSPKASPIRAAKIGVAPRIRAIVEALVCSSANTNESWFSQRQSAARTTRPRSERRIRSVRSATRAIAEEDQRRAAVADGGVRERLEPVREDVAGDGDVQRPQHHRRQQHQLGADRPPHPRERTGGAIPRAGGCRAAAAATLSAVKAARILLATVTAAAAAGRSRAWRRRRRSVSPPRSIPPPRRSSTAPRR